jgi:hypothetical protein
MERLLRWREPMAWLLLVAIAVRVVLGVVGVATLAGSRSAPRSLVAFSTSIGVVDEVAVTVLVGLVAWCTRDRTRRSRQLALAALVVCGTALAVALGLLAVEFSGADGASVFVVAIRLTGLVVPALAIAVLIGVLPRERSDGSRGHQDTATDPEPVQPESYLHSAGWEPDEASGAAWSSAAAAARGAGASGWGRGDEADGWDSAAWAGRESGDDADPPVPGEGPAGASTSPNGRA